MTQENKPDAKKVCPKCSNYMYFIQESKVIENGRDCWECQECGLNIEEGKLND